MATELIYRASSTATVPVSTSVKGTALTNAEIDGNMRSLQQGINAKPDTTTVQTMVDGAAIALAIALG